MEHTDGGLHPAVDGQSLGERRKAKYVTHLEQKETDRKTVRETYIRQVEVVGVLSLVQQYNHLKAKVTLKD